MIELWHAVHSTCSQKVRLCLAEKGLAWQGHLLDLRRFEQLEPQFLVLNPAAMVPVLRDRGEVIVESLAINEYLEDAYPEPRLRPADPLACARMRQWTLYIAAEPTAAVKVPSFMKNIRPELSGRHSRAEIEAIAARMPDRAVAERWVRAVTDGFTQEEIAASLRRLEATLDRMQAALAAGPWLAGEDYSLADIDMAPFVRRIAHLAGDAPIAARPRVADWYARMLARPAFAAAIP